MPHPPSTHPPSHLKHTPTPKHFYVITPTDSFMVKAVDVGEAANVAQSLTVQSQYLHIIDTEYGKKEVLH